MITQNEFVGYLKNVELVELRDLISTLEYELGVTIPVSSGIFIDEEVVVEEQTEFDVVITGFTDRKIDVIKAVRRMSDVGLREAKNMVQDAPSIVVSGVSKERAEEVAAALIEASGIVEIK